MSELSGQQLTIEITREQLHSLAEQAQTLGLTEGEAVQVLTAPNEDPAWTKLLDEVDTSTRAATHAIDEALAFVAASNKRIAKMEGHGHGTT